MRFSDRVKLARELAGFSQAELARRTGMSQPSINDLESGRTQSLRGPNLIRGAKALGQTPEWLATGGGVQCEPPLPPPPPATNEHAALLESFTKLTAAEKKIVVRMVRALAIDK